MRERTTDASRRFPRLKGHLILSAGLPPAILVGQVVAGQIGAVAFGAVYAAALALSICARRREETTTRDEDTGLPDRASALASLVRLLANPATPRRQAAVIIVEFAAGEERPHADVAAERLFRAAHRLAQGLRKGDQIARVGPTRLAALLETTRNLDAVALESVLARIATAFEKPLRPDEAPPQVAIGGCLQCDAPEPLAVSWLDAAEIAAHRAAATGLPCAFELHAHVADRRAELAAEIEEALRSGEIVPWLQPQIEVGTDRILGFEALARWLHPRHGVLPPSDFLPIVAVKKLELELFERMLNEVCRIARDWDAAGFRVPGFGVNVSSQALASPGLANTVSWLLDKHDVGPGRLNVELLETVESGDVACPTVEAVEALKRLGCRVELDDFGAGDAPFSRMLRFGAGRIKIDRAFVSGCDTDDMKRRAMRHMTTVAHTFGAQVLAEGVETEAERETALAVGCDAIQGFLIAPAMSANEALRWVQAHAARHPDTGEEARAALAQTA